MFILQKFADFYKRRDLECRSAAVVLLIALAVVAAMPSAQTVFLAQTNASKRKLPIYSVETQLKQVAISFDAAWDAADTEKILKILADNNVKASFFLCGIWVDRNPEELKMIYAAGHDIGNHGNTHAHVASLSFEKNKLEIADAHHKVKNILGISMDLFRPPYGEYNDTVMEAAEALGYYSVQWDVDTLDIKVNNYLCKHYI